MQDVENTAYERVMQQKFADDDGNPLPPMPGGHAIAAIAHTLDVIREAGWTPPAKQVDYPAMARHEAIKATILDALTDSHKQGREEMLETLLEADFGDPADWRPREREAFAEAAARALASGSGS